MAIGCCTSSLISPCARRRPNGWPGYIASAGLWRRLSSISQRTFHSVINTLGYPQAALFGFCRALVAYTMVAVVMAALRSVHGTEPIDQELSLYYVANDIAQTYHGMMIAIPEHEWRVFSRMHPAAMVATLKELAQKVSLKAYRKSPRGPKKPRPKREGSTKASHVSTAKILRNQNVNAATP